MTPIVWKMSPLLLLVFLVSLVSLSSAANYSEATNEIWAEGGTGAGAESHVANQTRSVAPKNLKLVGLEWKDCGSSSSLFHLRRLDMTPAFIHIPSKLNVDLDASFQKDVQAPIRMWVTLKRKVGWFWVKVPCVNNVGSCYYSDFCRVIPKIQINLPPSVKCPFKQGRWKEEDVKLTIGKIPLPKFLVAGKYGVKLEAHEADGTRIGCVKVSFNVK